jgi:hypothetical protein
LALFANHELKDGTRAGSKQISQFSKGFVDAIYAQLLMVEEKDLDGNIVKRKRRRFANAAMSACRRAWFVGLRAQEKACAGHQSILANGPESPFSKSARTGDAYRDLGRTRCIQSRSKKAWIWLGRNGSIGGLGVVAA